MNYKKKNYLCNKYNESFVSYCEKCKDNICICIFELEHYNEHKIKPLKEIVPNLNKY